MPSILLVIIAVWFVGSLPIALLVGRFIAGKSAQPMAQQAELEMPVAVQTARS